MKTSTSTTVIERLIDLELIFKLKADLARFKKKSKSANNKQLPNKAAQLRLGKIKIALDRNKVKTYLRTLPISQQTTEPFVVSHH